ncbi:hypothetical protein ACN38_g13199, partial [Penicillium nordicum]
KERKRETGYGLNYESCQTGSHAAPHGCHVITNKLGRAVGSSSGVL